jgi:hypothetical protein
MSSGKLKIPHALSLPFTLKASSFHTATETLISLSATYSQDQKYTTVRQKTCVLRSSESFADAKVEKNPWLQYCQHICCESDPTPDLVTRNQTLDCRQISLSAASIAATSNACGHYFGMYVFRLSGRQNCMNSSRADSRVNCLKISNVSETLSLHTQGKVILYFSEDGDRVSLRNVGGF